MYGLQANKHYGVIGGSVFKKWGQYLQHFSNDQLRRGLDMCLESSSDFPPGLKVFIGFCKNQTPGLRQDTAAYRMAPKLLESQKATKQTRNIEIRKIKEALKQ